MTNDNILNELDMLRRQTEPATHETIAREEADLDDAASREDDDDSRRAVIVSFDDIEERKTEWLWHNKIPAGELCLLSGLPGQGKTFWMCYLAAMVSNGGDWPDGTPCPRGNVLYFPPEDSVDKTIKPRLKANGADMSNVFLIENQLTDGTVMNLHHVNEIRDAIRAVRENNGLPVRLVIIDPMADHIGNTKENSNVETRNVLKQLKNIAEETGVTFLLVQHIGKADRETMQQRVLGSTGIVASCRASFCLFKEQGTERRIFAPMKNNLAVNPTSVIFTIDPSIKGGQVQIVDHSVEKSADDYAEEMRAASQQKRGRPNEELIKAKEWLLNFLRDGRKPVGQEKGTTPGTIYYEAMQAGHSSATIRRVKNELGIINKSENRVSYWSLPASHNLTEQVAEDTKLVSGSKVPRITVADVKAILSDQNSLCPETPESVGQNADLDQEKLNPVIATKNGKTAKESPQAKSQQRPKKAQPKQPQPSQPKQAKPKSAPSKTAQKKTVKQKSVKQKSANPKRNRKTGEVA